MSEGELSDIRQIGGYRNAGGSGGKYFAETLEDAVKEAKYLEGLDGARYTITSTLVPERFARKMAHTLEVDGGVKTIHVGEWLEFDLLRISKKYGVRIEDKKCP